MPRALFLHIGYPKTGSTSLQSFFALNTDTLRAHGVCYPLAGRVNNAHYGISNCLGLGFRQTPGAEMTLDSLLDQIAGELDRAACSRALISSEHFIRSREPLKIRDAFSAFEVKIIVFLRRHDHLFESSYSQGVKTSTARLWNGMVQSFVLQQIGTGAYSYDYLSVLRSWAEAFGRENVVVRTVENGQPNDKIYRDMMEILAIPAATQLPLPGALNQAISYQAVVAIDAVQRSSCAAGFKSALIDRIVRGDALNAGPDRPALLSHNDRHAIVSIFRRTYPAIAREFLGREDGLLFEEPFPQRDATWEPPPAPAQQAVIDMILHAAEALAGPPGRDAAPRPKIG